MNYKALLEKYWAGETTIAEEKALLAYFNSNEVATELARYISLFQYLDEAKKETLKPSIENLLITHNSKKHFLKTVASNYFYRSIAAAVLILVIASIGFQTRKSTSETKAERMANYWASKEIKDPKEAFIKTKAALLLVSKKLNNGTNAAFKQVVKVQQVGQFIKSPD